jgi:hypothetical protein
MLRNSTLKLGDTPSSPNHITPMFVDGMHVNEFLFIPCMHACRQQTIDGKLVSKKCCKNYGGASSLVAILSSLVKTFNKN